MLWALLERLGVEHPYHSLCQLLALARGNLDRLGKPMSQGSDAAHHVDLDKVIAADTLLQRIAQQPDRQAWVQPCPVVPRQAGRSCKLVTKSAAA